MAKDRSPLQKLVLAQGQVIRQLRGIEGLLGSLSWTNQTLSQQEKAVLRAIAQQVKVLCTCYEANMTAQRQQLEEKLNERKDNSSR